VESLLVDEVFFGEFSSAAGRRRCISGDFERSSSLHSCGCCAGGGNIETGEGAGARGRGGEVEAEVALAEVRDGGGDFRPWEPCESCRRLCGAAAGGGDDRVRIGVTSRRGCAEGGGPHRDILLQDPHRSGKH